MTGQAQVEIETTSSGALAGIRESLSHAFVWVQAASLVVLLGFVGGCAGDRARGAPSGADPKPAPAPVSAPVSAAASKAAVPVRLPAVPLSTWVSRALDGEVNVVDSPAITGREQEFFLALLARVANETRDVDPVVRSAARRLASTDGGRGGVVVVRELWARECCMRRSSLAGGLLGLVDGMKAVAAGGIPDAGAALMLGELADHPDAAVAKAARAALRFFEIEPGENGSRASGEPDP